MKRLSGTARLALVGSIVGCGIADLIGFGVLLQSPITLNIVGYLVAFAMPVVGVVLLVQIVRRYPLLRWPVGVPALIIFGVLVAIGRGPVGELVGSMAVALGPQLPKMLIILLFAGIGAGWAAVLIAALADTPASTRATAWVVRHRITFTVIAACCPLPYALIRLTWLTPWPQLAGDGLDMSLRIWGLLLSCGAWLGVVLTLGLIRPWGEVFPRWVPVVAGRKVPIVAAVIPGGLVATVLCFTAVPWLYAAGSNIPDRYVDAAIRLSASIVVFPCWLWGPTLALAVWGYAGHRRDTARDQRNSTPDLASLGVRRTTPTPRPARWARMGAWRTIGRACTPRHGSPQPR